jgi:hypothetical protein
MDRWGLFRDGGGGGGMAAAMALLSPVPKRWNIIVWTSFSLKSFMLKMDESRE